jgi:hypothetical protein
VITPPLGIGTHPGRLVLLGLIVSADAELDLDEGFELPPRTEIPSFPILYSLPFLFTVTPSELSNLERLPSFSSVLFESSVSALGCGIGVAIAIGELLGDGAG